MEHENPPAIDAHELVEACSRMEDGAQHRLFDFLKDKMMGVCLRYAKNEQQANEILLATSVLVFGSVKNMPAGESFDDWLKTCIVKSAITILQRNKTEYNIASTAHAREIIVHQHAMTEAQIAASINDNDTLKSIQSLTPSYRLVVNMYLLDNYSFKAISEILDISEGTIRLNFDKAMYQLRKNIVQLTTAGDGE